MNRKSLIVLIFAVTLVIAPAARAQILSPDSGGGGLAYKANSRPAGMSQAEYRALIDDATAARAERPGPRRRTLGRLRRELRRIRARDHFPPAERELAQQAVEELAALVEERVG